MKTIFKILDKVFILFLIFSVTLMIYKWVYPLANVDAFTDILSEFFVILVLTMAMTGFYGVYRLLVNKPKPDITDDAYMDDLFNLVLMNTKMSLTIGVSINDEKIVKRDFQIEITGIFPNKQFIEKAVRKAEHAINENKLSEEIVTKEFVEKLVKSIIRTHTNYKVFDSIEEALAYTNPPEETLTRTKH